MGILTLVDTLGNADTPDTPGITDTLGILGTLDITASGAIIE